VRGRLRVAETERDALAAHCEIIDKEQRVRPHSSR
jgi:hypothetical protein